MRTVLVEPPEELRSWLERRRALGQDLYDEVWEGEYHVAPAPHPGHGDVDHQLVRLLGPLADAAGLRGSGPMNIGEADDYRVPDAAYSRQRPTTTFVPSVALAVEIASPRDETWDKLAFYFDRGIEELLIVDLAGREVQWLVRGPTAFEPTAASRLLDITAADLAAALDWPPQAE
ncbi:hypothetical protein BH23ACT9_BH23ACT9_34960 [soil metagenome]